MPEDHTSLINLINSSGFLFQFCVEQEIRRTSDRHGYTVAASEYHWSSRSTGSDGYIDILVEKDITRIVIECKRLRDTNWLFLVKNNSAIIPKARLLWTQRKTEQPHKMGWDELNVEPNSLESSICVMRGQSDRDKPILERLLSILTTSIESLAEEELAFQPQYSDEAHLYVSVIVTNGDLAVCRFDPNAVDIESGELPTDSGTIEMVPFIRFRKSLSTTVEEKRKPTYLVDAGRLKNVLFSW